VSVSPSIIKTLTDREWVRVLGHKDVPGRPELFGTTRAFLDSFSLKSLDQLPPLSDIQDIDEMHDDLFAAVPLVAVVENQDENQEQGQGEDEVQDEAQDEIQEDETRADGEPATSGAD
jgi:segregation and condensation protein B